MNNKYTVGDLFAGAGGLSKAFQKAGAEVVWANEIDKNACRLYRENFSDVCLIEGNIKNIVTEKIPDIDVLIGGFPCQSFSIAGQRNGFFERENLFSEFLRILEAKKPRVFLLENVKNLIYIDNGRILEKIIDAFIQQGYFIEKKVLNSKDYGNIPHNKERLYIVGFRDIKEFETFKFPKKIQLDLKVNDIIDIGGKKEEDYYYNENSRYYKIFNKEVKNKGRIYQLKLISRKQSNFDNEIVKNYDICPALTSYISKTEYVPMIKDNYGVRILTPNECFMMQGFWDIKIAKDFKEKWLYKYAAECSSVEVVKRIAINIFEILDTNIQGNILERSFNNSIENLVYEVDQEITIKTENENIPQNIILDVIKQEFPIKNEDITLQKELYYAIKQEVQKADEKKIISQNENIEQIKQELSLKTEGEFNIQKDSYNEKKQQTPIKNEKEFTLRKVIPALRKKEFLEIRYNHGSDEFGKDVIYKYLDNFGSVKCGAVQVKYGDISGDTKGEIETILIQIEDSFEMPYIDINENRKNYINQLLVICSGRYTKNAKEKILEKFKRRYDVRFFDGQDIDNLLEQ